MPIADILATLFTNLGVSGPVFITIVTALGCFIIMAKEFRIGLIFMLLFNTLEFIVFYHANYDTTISLIVTLTSFALMAISLLITSKKSQVPYRIR